MTCIILDILVTAGILTVGVFSGAIVLLWGYLLMNAFFRGDGP